MRHPPCPTSHNAVAMKRGVVSLTSSLLNLLKAIIRIVCKCAKYPLQVVIALFRLLRLHSSRHSRPRRPSHTDDDTRKLEEGTPTIRVSTAGQSLQHPLILPSMDHSHSLPSRLLPSSTTPERHEYDLPPPAEANLQDQDLREADIVDHRLDISQEVVVPIPSLYPPPPPTANSHRSGHTDETCVEEDEEGQEGGSGGEDRPGHVAVQMFDQPDVDILGDPAGRNVAEREPERDEGGDDIDPFIYPILPSDITRYDRQRYIDPSRHASYTVRARQMGDDFLDEVLPNGWVKLIHPEGLPYFWHPEERILTESWICDTEVMNHLNEFICRIRDYERAANVIQTENVSLVLQLVIEDDEDWWCGYYFANHADLSLYWHEDFKIDNKLGEVKGDITNSFAKLFLEREYWNHWALYPHACEATLKVIRIVETALTDAGTDIITSFNSNVNMNFDTVGSMLSLLGRAKGARLVENENGSSTPKDDLPAPSAWMIGRFMLMLSRDRFLNYYGQKHARLDRRQSVFGNPSFCSLKDPTILFRVLSPLLFCAPDVHLNTLEEIWVDKLTLLDLWNEFFARLCEEWKAQLVFASLLLTSNIGFLTMPMVSPEGAPSHGTFVQIASYVSTIASISSIVLGLLLSRHYQNHQNRDKVDARGLHKRMLSLHLETYGFQPLAVLYSLPYALLMWGMITFLIAFTSMCFHNSSRGARVLTSFAWFLMAILVVWYIYMSWDGSTNRWLILLDEILPGSRSSLLECSEKLRQCLGSRFGGRSSAASSASGTASGSETLGSQGHDSCSQSTTSGRTNISRARRKARLEKYKRRGSKLVDSIADRLGRKRACVTAPDVEQAV